MTKVPTIVFDWIRLCKERGAFLGGVLVDVRMPLGVANWFYEDLSNDTEKYRKRQEDFARIWLDWGNND